MVKSSTSSKPDTKKAESKKGEERLDPSKRGVSKSEEPPTNTVVGFLRETRAELDRVVWPTRAQLISKSTGVLLLVLAFALFIYLIDQLFSWIATQIFS